MITLIAAVGKNLELGSGNELIWHLKNDMRFFRETTMSHTVVMGRKTYESIGKLLPNRRNIVLTHSKIDGVETCDNIEKILELSESEEIFIIGGASIYELFLPYASKMYLTKINDSRSADAYFPEFDKYNYDEEILEKEVEDGIEYTIALFKRK